MVFVAHVRLPVRIVTPHPQLIRLSLQLHDLLLKLVVRVGISLLESLKLNPVEMQRLGHRLVLTGDFLLKLTLCFLHVRNLCVRVAELVSEVCDL